MPLPTPLTNSNSKFFIKTFPLATVILIIALIFLTLTFAVNNIKKHGLIGQADSPQNTITVTGVGKVTARNDVAVMSIGFTNVAKDVTTGEAANKKVMDPIMAELKQLGIPAPDITTDYSITPEYNYTTIKGQELTGYRVTNTAAVKIRDLSKIAAVVGLGGKYGANQVTGLTFTVDDREPFKDQARQKALTDAVNKAHSLAAALGVRLVAMSSYGEYEGAPIPMPLSDQGGPAGGGVGGNGPTTVASGSNDVIMNVSITYAVAPLQ